jgi:hypothetical protein
MKSVKRSSGDRHAALFPSEGALELFELTREVRPERGQLRTLELVDMSKGGRPVPPGRTWLGESEHHIDLVQSDGSPPSEGASSDWKTGSSCMLPNAEWISENGGGSSTGRARPTSM